MHSLQDAAGGSLSATAGTEFAERAAVVARDEQGAGVAGVTVEFRIVGDTDSRFADGATTATATTGADGTATAPVLLAGEKTGEFTVRATVVERATLPGVDHRATVTAPPRADALARAGTTEPTAAAGGEFAERLTVTATHKGAAAAGVALTATMIAGTDSSQAADAGPYFKDAQGEPVRTLAGLETGADGTLRLPRMYADDRAGTFLLRVTAEGGVTLTIELHVD
ncbi:hypothetical protein BJP40_29135 [Streptomyces sp. CC53]|nr:hypothetical protein BJP40_29135 [Streptomyces sp. CC53]